MSVSSRSARRDSPAATVLGVALALLLGAGLLGGLPACGPLLVAADRKDVDVLLDRFHEAAAEADEERYFDSMAAGGVFLGTDAGERWDKAAFQAFAHPYFAKGTGWAYAPFERHVAFSAGGDVAWFDEKLLNEKYGEVRGSGVLVHEGGAWKIAHYVLSFAVPNGVAKEVVRTVACSGFGEGAGERCLEAP